MHYKRKECKIGGLVKNLQKPNIPLSKELLSDIKSIGIDYIITEFSQDDSFPGQRDSIDNLLETLSNADEVGVDVIATYVVFCKNKKDEDVIHYDNKPHGYWWHAENQSIDRIKEAMKHKSFAGIFRDEPSDTDECFENIKKFRELYNGLGVKFDLNLFPNYTFVFNNNVNMWDTGRTFKEYVERYAQINDTIGVDFYPIIFSDGSYIKNRMRTWTECLNTLLDLSHKYPEKDYKMFIQVTQHESYGVITPETLSLQTYVSLIGGATDVRYFCLTDGDNPFNSFTNSPYTSDHNGYQHGLTHDVVNNFNNDEKFKSFKDIITSLYISKIDYYINGVSKFNNIKQDEINKFVNQEQNGEMVVSIASDDENNYLLIVNSDFSSPLKLIVDDNRVKMLTQNKYKHQKAITINCCDVCVLRKSKYGKFKTLWNRFIKFIKKLF